LDEDDALEVEAGREAQVLVRRPGVAVGAAVLTAAVWVDAEVEADVRAVVAGYRRPRGVVQVAGSDVEVVLADLLQVELHLQPCETVAGVRSRAPAAMGPGVGESSPFVLGRHASDTKVWSRLRGGPAVRTVRPAPAM